MYSNVSDENRATSAREMYYRSKCAKIESKHAQPQVEIETLRSEIHVLHDELMAKEEVIKQLHMENDQLHDQLHHQHDHTIMLYDVNRRHYTPATQRTVYTLLQHHVGTQHVAPVIEAVLKLGDRAANKLPSKSTVNDMNIQRLALSQKQLSDALPNLSNLTLQSDEASKYGAKYMGYEAQDMTGGSWGLGLRYIETKSAAHCLDT